MSRELSEHVALFQIKDPKNQDFSEKLHLEKQIIRMLLKY